MCEAGLLLGLRGCEDQRGGACVAHAWGFEGDERLGLRQDESEKNAVHFRVCRHTRREVMEMTSGCSGKRLSTSGSPSARLCVPTSEGARSPRASYEFNYNPFHVLHSLRTFTPKERAWRTASSTAGLSCC